MYLKLSKKLKLRCKKQLKQLSSIIGNKSYKKSTTLDLSEAYIKCSFRFCHSCFHNILQISNEEAITVKAMDKEYRNNDRTGLT